MQPASPGAVDASARHSPGEDSEMVRARRAMAPRRSWTNELASRTTPPSLDLPSPSLTDYAGATQRRSSSRSPTDRSRSSADSERVAVLTLQVEELAARVQQLEAQLRRLRVACFSVATQSAQLVDSFLRASGSAVRQPLPPVLQHAAAPDAAPPTLEDHRRVAEAVRDLLDGLLDEGLPELLAEQLRVSAEAHRRGSGGSPTTAAPEDPAGYVAGDSSNDGSRSGGGSGAQASGSDQ